MHKKLLTFDTERQIPQEKWRNTAFCRTHYGSIFSSRQFDNNRLIDRLIDYCITSSEQYFSYICQSKVLDLFDLFDICLFSFLYSFSYIALLNNLFLSCKYSWNTARWTLCNNQSIDQSIYYCQIVCLKICSHNVSCRMQYSHFHCKIYIHVYAVWCEKYTYLKVWDKLINHAWKFMVN
jgi:hypothetical protein